MKLAIERLCLSASPVVWYTTRLTAIVALVLLTTPGRSLAQRSTSYPTDARAFGKAVADAFVAQYGRAVNVKWEHQLDTIVASLRTAAGYPDSIEFVIIRDSAVNARAAPGGYLIINEGLLLTLESISSQLTNPAERFTSFLAAVIAHEIGHLTLGHSDSLLKTVERLVQDRVVETIDRQQQLTIALQQGLSSLEELEHSRERETAADRVGALYLLRAGWMIQDAMDLFRAFDELARTDLSYYSLESVTYLSEHPRAAEREANLEAFRAELKLLQVRYDDAIALIGNNIGLESAVQLLDEVLLYFPSLLVARHARGVAFHRLWLNSASTSALRVRSSLPTYQTHFLPLVRGLPGDLSLFRMAQVEYESVIGVEPFRATLSNLALLKAYAGDFGTAESLARRAATDGLPDAQLVNNLGVVLYLSDRREEASEAFQQAFELGPTSAVLFNLARSELELNRARGRELLREFIAVGEDSPWHDEAVGLLGDTLSPSATATPLAPTVAGVGLGSAALQVSGRLGIPSSRERKGEYMVWRYDDQGLAFFFTASDEVALFMVFAGTDYTIEGVAPGQAVTSIYATLGMPHERSEGALYYVRSGWYLIIQTRKGMVTAVAATAKDGT